MTSGATARFIFPNATLAQVLAAYERSLILSGFKIRQREPSGASGYVHKAVWGSKAEAYLVGSLLPFGKLVPAGSRLGAEAQLSVDGDDIVLRVAVVPYEELFDSPEVFLLTQDIFEKITDDEFSREKLDDIAQRIRDVALRSR